ncbi:hypothetical protein ACFQVC_40925 [Streptomyces monticola]|uniref:Uncharacterized protein n=1 Tax=Streptomyces monticola TaxID=2666263 RepID=A0ABW2JYG6_9ACTN
MSQTSGPHRPLRAAAEINAEIRALWERTDGRLSPEQRQEYESLVTEWAAAIRAGAVQAA